MLVTEKPIAPPDVDEAIGLVGSAGRASRTIVLSFGLNLLLSSIATILSRADGVSASVTFFARSVCGTTTCHPYKGVAQVAQVSQTTDLEVAARDTMRHLCDTLG